MSVTNLSNVLDHVIYHHISKTKLSCRNHARAETFDMIIKPSLNTARDSAAIVYYIHVSKQGRIDRKELNIVNMDIRTIA